MPYATGQLGSNIDASEIVAAEQCTISATAFTIQHNNKPVVLITLSGVSQSFVSSVTTAIADGSVDGQVLTLILRDDGTNNNITIKSGANTFLRGDWYRDNDETWLKLVWDGSNWVEVGRDNGSSNSATGLDSHAEGNTATASGNNSHAEGSSTTASGSRCHAEGNSTTAGTGANAHAEGNSCQASANHAHAEGNWTQASGSASHAEGDAAVASGAGSHAMGKYSKSRLDYMFAQASGRFAATGDAQFTRTVMRNSTIDATTTELFIDGSSLRWTLDNEHTYACTITIAARQDSGGDNAMFKRMVVITRNAGTVALEGAVQTIGTDINPGTLGGVTLSADDINKSLKVEVTGKAATNLRWVAVIEAVEVGY